MEANNEPAKSQTVMASVRLMRLAVRLPFVTAAEVSAQAPSPDVLVHSTTDEVLAIMRTDKEIQAGKPRASSN